MKITGLSIAVSRTVMVAPYQPLKLEAGASCDLDPTADDAEAEIERGREALLAEVRLSLRAAYTSFHPKHQPPEAAEEKPNAQ